MAEIAPFEDQAATTDLPVGEILRRTRLHYDQSIPDIEKALRIRASQIEAIEVGNLDALPGRVYAIGFVRSYSEYLGLDGDKMVELFKRQAAGTAPQPELNFPIPANESQLPAWWIMPVCILGVVAVFVFWFNENEVAQKAINEIPEVPARLQAPPEPETSALEASAEELAVQEGPEEPEIEEKPAEGIILNIRQNSWVEIRDQSGKAMLSRVLSAGDQYYVPDRPDLTISIGNAGGVEIEVDGQALKPLGKTGKVLRRLPLDAKYLKENFALEEAQ